MDYFPIFGIVKTGIVISLLFIFLTANTELHQLLRLPALIHHFLEHTRQNRNESLATFLIEHYAGENKHCDNKQGDHDNLPFKAGDCSPIHKTIACNTPAVFLLTEPMGDKADIGLSPPPLSISSAFLSSIWQPPRILTPVRDC